MIPTAILRITTMNILKTYCNYIKDTWYLLSFPTARAAFFGMASTLFILPSLSDNLHIGISSLLRRRTMGWLVSIDLYEVRHKASGEAGKQPFVFLSDPRYWPANERLRSSRMKGATPRKRTNRRLENTSQSELEGPSNQKTRSPSRGRFLRNSFHLPSMFS